MRVQGRNYNTNAAENSNANNALESMLRPEVFNFIFFNITVLNFQPFFSKCSIIFLTLSRFLNFITRIVVIEDRNVKLMKLRRTRMA